MSRSDSWVIAGAVYGVCWLLALVLRIKVYLGEQRFIQPVEFVLIICGVPWILVAQLLAEMIFVGLIELEESGSDSGPRMVWAQRLGCI